MLPYSGVVGRGESVLRGVVNESLFYEQSDRAVLAADPWPSCDMYRAEPNSRGILLVNDNERMLVCDRYSATRLVDFDEAKSLPSSLMGKIVINVSKWRLLTIFK